MNHAVFWVTPSIQTQFSAEFYCPIRRKVLFRQSNLLGSIASETNSWCFYSLNPSARTVPGALLPKTRNGYHSPNPGCILGSEERPWDCSGASRMGLPAPQANLNREETE